MSTQQATAPWRVWAVAIAAVLLWVAFVGQFVVEADRGWSVWLMLVAAVLMTFSAVATILKR
jgi:hypothetical protein